MTELPDIIYYHTIDSKGNIRTKPLKELMRELITNYNQLIAYLEETDGRTEEQTSED